MISLNNASFYFFQVLRTLGETINRSLEALQSASAASSGRDPLYDSSSASSSGFSDLTPTPTSSSTESRLHDASMIYGVLQNHHKPPGGGYEKLCSPDIKPPPPIYEAPPVPTKSQPQHKKSSDNYVSLR